MPDVHPLTPAARRAFIEAHVPGWLTHEEGEALYDLAWAARPSRGAIVELGAWKGRSTCYLAWGALAGDMAPVVSIDHFCGSPEHRCGGLLGRDGNTYADYLATLSQAGILLLVHSLIMDTDQAERIVTDQIGLLFIDADHTERAVRRDYALWVPKVMPGGWVCLHDVDSPDWPGPTRLGAELRHSGEWAEIRQVDTLLMLRKRP